MADKVFDPYEFREENARNSFSDRDLRMMITGNNPVSNAYRELLAYRQAAREPHAHIFEHPNGKLFWSVVDASCALDDDVTPVYAIPRVLVEGWDDAGL